MTAMNINNSCYVIAVDNTSKSATLTPMDTNCTSVILYNGSTNPVFVVSGVTAPTAVFPTSSTVPVGGKVIGPGATVLYTKNENHGFISAIQASAGTGSLYIHVGAGQ